MTVSDIDRVLFKNGALSVLFLKYSYDYCLYLHQKYHIILPKTKVKKSQMSAFSFQRKREAGGNGPLERNCIEETKGRI